MAQSGSKALELLDQEPMDILLTDIMMPEMDGYELMKKVRDKGMDRLPIVALTAKAMQGDKDICLSRGANDYVSKPIDMDQLISVIGRLVKG